MKTIDIVVPCYNEGESLNLFYEETQRVSEQLPDYKFQYIFVDDGSKDNTYKIMCELAEKDESVNCISFSRNFGKEAAMYAGLQNSTGDYVCIIDADLQHPPKMIIQMMAEIEKGHDCCAARRVTRAGEPKLRSAFSRLFYKLINKMSEIEVVDGAVDFRVMSRQMVDAILELSEVQRFSKGIFVWVGFDTQWIEFENVERIAGESKWSFWSLLKYAIDGITSFTTVPLRFASVVGTVISMSSFIYLLVVIIQTLVKGITVPGYATTIVLLLFLGGIIILSCGVLGEYIARLYTEVKKRPVYIAKHNTCKKKAEHKTEHGCEVADK